MIDRGIPQGRKGGYRMGVRSAYTQFCCRVGEAVVACKCMARRWVR